MLPAPAHVIDVSRARSRAAPAPEDVGLTGPADEELLDRVVRGIHRAALELAAVRSAETEVAVAALDAALHDLNTLALRRRTAAEGAEW
jgi:hypothetical protein